MAAEWQMSDSFRAWLHGLLQSADGTDLAQSCYPSVVWSLGGEMQRSGGEKLAVPARYSIGWIRKEDLGRFIGLEDDLFGYVAFQPRQRDTAAPNRVLHVVNDEILVN